MITRSLSAVLGLCLLSSACVAELGEGEPEASELEQGLTPLQLGREVWFNKTYGGEKFFLFLKNHPDPTKRIDIGFVNVLETPRHQRFDVWGVINDPDCTANPLGGFDICPDPQATGVVGMRKFPGPGGTTMFGSSCASCHAGFDPLNPPANPNNPTWANIHATIGNQYTKFGKIFAANLAPTDPRNILLNSWPDGAVDTQLLFSDNINNPGVVTAFWEWPNRPTFDTDPGPGKNLQNRNGQGGEDDLGPGIAAQRVYTNIGVCFQECTAPAVTLGVPIDIESCKASCADYPPDSDLDALGTYLSSFKAPKYPGKPKGLVELVAATYGLVVFAANCASCHDITGKQKHVLSNDKIIPLASDPVNATNACRAKTTMWERGQLWDQFSSEVYKQNIEAGKRGYRNMPLSGIWSTAPFLHNQSIGTWAPASATPAQRLQSYYESMTELLSANRTPKINTIPVALGPFPAGTPTTLVFSRDPDTGEVLCDDVVENRGHYYGSRLDPVSKAALIFWLQFQ